MKKKNHLDAFSIEQEDNGIRLDKVLFKKFQNLNFVKVQKLIRVGFFKVNQKRVKSNYRVNSYDLIQYNNKLVLENVDNSNNSLSQVELKYEKRIAEVKKNIIFEDNFLLVINKPSGIPVQGGNKVGFHIDLVLPFLSKDKSCLRLVHRIDKDTSGILLLAKSKDIARKVTMLFRENKIKKKYLAIVIGKLNKNEGEITLPIKKNIVEGREKMDIDYSSEEIAETFYKVIDYKKELSLLEVYPKTGRKHQIRVHLKNISTPILGDNKYFLISNNNKNLNSKKMHLHAREIKFNLNNNKYNFTADLPSYFKDTIRDFKMDYQYDE